MCISPGYLESRAWDKADVLLGSATPSNKSEGKREMRCGGRKANKNHLLTSWLQTQKKHGQLFSHERICLLRWCLESLCLRIMIDLKGLPYHPQAAYFYPLSRVPADSSSHTASLLSTKPFLLQTRLSFETKVCILLISVPSKLTKFTVWQVLTNCLLSE